MSNETPFLPQEVQTLIIKYVPQEDWCKIESIPCLVSGLTDICLWKIVCADSFGDSVNDDIVRLLEKYCQSTEAFYWHNSLWVSTTTVESFFSSLEKLSLLDLSYNGQIRRIDFVCSYQETLTYLSLSNCTLLRRFNTITNVLFLSELTYLDLSESCVLHINDVLRISKRLKNLRHINIRECVSLPHNVVSIVDTNLVNLENFLFCVILDVNDTGPWANIYLQHPRLQICPAALDIILAQNPHLLQ